MPSTVLFSDNGHHNVLLPDFDSGEAVPCNQHLIIDGQEAMLLDPGGARLYPSVMAAVPRELRSSKLKYIFCSHQDPDIVASLNGWLMTTEATGLCAEVWRRFLPHFGSERLMYARVQGIPDGGMPLKLGNRTLLVLPAHFLHSVGNFQVYDPTSKILYTGDLGASLGEPDREVHDFDAHLAFMEGFHRRYMVSNQAMRAWVRMVRPLDIEILAPQHGALFRGKEMVSRFLDWAEGFACGLDWMEPLFQVPAAE